MLSFLMLPVLVGCLAVAIPLLVHLLHRQKVTPMEWGAMQFLLETPLKVKRRKRIDNWLLMLVRMAIVLIVALLLARPILKTSQLATSTPADVVVVIDHSMTMGMRAGSSGGSGGTLFDQGIDVAESVSKMLPASGTMSLVLAEHVPKVITPTPIRMGPQERAGDGKPQGAWGDSLKMLRQLKPGTTRGNIAAAVTEAREILTHGYHMKKVIIVVSDDQRTNWEPGNEQLWKNAVGNVDATSERMGSNLIFSFPVRPGSDAASSANVSVRGVTVLPAFVGVHRPARILATIANSGGKDLTAVPVRLDVDGKTITTQTLARLAVGDSTTASFDYYFPDAGSHWVRVSAALVDGLEADNAGTAAVNVKPRLPVLVIDGQLTGGSGVGGTGNFPAAEFLVAAMQPVDPSIDPVALIDPKVISAAELATARGVRVEDYPIVVLNDVPRLTREWVDRLAAHAQGGNGVLVILGPRTEEGFVNEVLGRSALAPLTDGNIVRATQAGGPSQSPLVGIDIKEPTNAAVALMTHGGQAEHQAAAGVMMRTWWKITPSAGMHTVLATTTGDPFAVEMETGRVGGSVILWTSGIGDPAWNNLPLEPHFFVPLVQETLFHLASGLDAGQPRQVEAGEPMVWRGSAAQMLESAIVVRPDGVEHALQPQLRQDHYYVEERETGLPGLYEMRFSAPAKAGAVAPAAVYFSVQTDPQELDPAVLSPADVDWFKGHGYLKEVLGPGTLAKALEATQGGMDVWWILGILLLGLLLLELLMTFKLVREQAGSKLEGDGLAVVMPEGR